MTPGHKGDVLHVAKGMPCYNGGGLVETLRDNPWFWSPGPLPRDPLVRGYPPSCRRKTRVFDGSEGVDTESKGLPDGTWVRLEG